MTFTNDQALGVVSTYRNTYFGIPLLWQKLELKLTQTLQASHEEDWHGLKFKDKKIHLPNGMALHYNELHLWHGKLTYKGRGLAPETTWGGRIAENVVQALSRIVVTDAMLRIKNDPTLDADIVLTVHDEIIIISEANDPDATMRKLIQHMCTPPAWAPDIPLDAEGGYDVSYSK
jgi:DNA polymerase